LIVFQSQNQIVMFKKKRIRYIDPYLKWKRLMNY
jgi:hypothetical protein